MENAEKRNDKYIQITVKDSGHGIAEADLAHVFEPFYTTKDIGEGTGLGLTSVYGAIEHMGGHMTVDSELGSGTQFELFLPLVKDVVEPSTEYQAETNKRIKAKSILMVDDEPTIREWCQDYFEVLGHNAIFAADAKHAICEYQKHWHQIDVVILDMVMPKVSGKELFKTLKDINPNIIAIVASGYTAENSVDELLKMGVQNVIDKPFRLEVLKEAIGEVSR